MTRRIHMDKIVKFNHRLKRRPSRQTSVVRPSRAEAERAVSTLIRWAGDDPDREGLIETPARVAPPYEQWFAGYDEHPEGFLQRTLEEIAGYDEMVLLRDIRFVSHCEHHMAPVVGRAHIGYLPHNRVVAAVLNYTIDSVTVFEIRGLGISASSEGPWAHQRQLDKLAFQSAQRHY